MIKFSHLTTILLWIVLCWPLSSPGTCAERAHPSADMDTLIHNGLYDLYNLNYADAKKKFQRLKELFPSHPIGAYALTTAYWWELTNDYDEENDLMEKFFLESVDETIDISKSAIKQKDLDGMAHMCLGGAFGLKSRWQAIQGHWFRAYRNGKKAFKAQKKAIKINPRMYDAYLGVGIFHYYTATLPGIIKLLAKLIFNGNKEQGLQEIHLAMEKGQFSRTASKLFLIGIYLNIEKEPLKALALVNQGRQEFPESPFFHFLKILVLENAQQWDNMRLEARHYLEQIDKNAPYYSQKHIHRGYYALANSYLGEGRAKEALPLYHRTITDVKFDDRWISLTHLNRGKTYDILNEREKALHDYRTVLKRRNVWGLHGKAKKLIKKQYVLEIGN